jgi:hypothetical protein
MTEQLPGPLADTLERMKSRFKPGTVDKTITYYLSLGGKIKTSNLDLLQRIQQAFGF